jgi:hypothetical protein
MSNRLIQRSFFPIEEAARNQFDSKAWISASKDAVDHKFAYAVSEVTTLILVGQVEVREVSDMFGWWKFEDYGGPLGMMAYQEDPSRGGKSFFHQNDYYFSILDRDALGAIGEIERIMTDPKVVW